MRLVVLPVLAFLLACSWSAGAPPAMAAGEDLRGRAADLGLPVWGVSDEDWPPGNTVLAELTSALGRRPDIVSWYVQAASNYPRGTRSGPYWEDNRDRVRAVIEAGQAPMITWEFGDQRLQPGTYFPLQDIIGGRYDDYLDRWAAGVRDDVGDGIIYLRPFHEMNLIDYSWSVHPNNKLGNTPSQLALAWRHVVDRFRAAGADNVRWVFNLGGDAANNPLPAGAYPGDAYVDFIGADSYGNAPPNSLAIDATHIDAIANKPWLMGEVAGPAEWVASELIPFARQHGAALVWFNKPPWPLSPGAAATGAVREMLAILPPGPAANSLRSGQTNDIGPDGVLSLIVFPGGTLRDLVAAARCPGQLAFWVSAEGGFVTYLPGTSVAAVNAPFLAMFPGDLPPNTVLMRRCARS